MIFQILFILGFATLNPQPATDQVNDSQTQLVVAPVNEHLVITLNYGPVK